MTHNEALQHLDLVVQLVLEENENDMPLADPGAGNICAIGASPEVAGPGSTGMASRFAAWRGRAAAGIFRNPLTHRRW